MAVDVEPDPDQAWKALSLVNDWIRHAETKIAATLAGAGVSGGLLYNVAREWPSPSVLALIVGNLAAFLLVATAWMCGMGLVPRRNAIREQGLLDLARGTLLTTALQVASGNPQGDKDTEEDSARDNTVGIGDPPEAPVNLLFYSSIVKHYGDDGPGYKDVLAALTSDRTSMTKHIAQQVWANASVAERKYNRANFAIRWLLTAWVLLAALSYLRVIGW